MKNPIHPALLSLLLGVSGCATRLQGMSYEQQRDILPAFQEGRTTLDCGVACALPWITRREALYGLYVTRQWDALAAEVSAIGYREDLAYYWLGRAAEAQGFLPAAARYYAVAEALARDPNPVVHCTTNMRNGCFGIDVRRGAAERFAAVRAALSAAYRPPQPVLPPTRGEPPYDPAPFYPAGRPVPLLPPVAPRDDGRFALPPTPLDGPAAASRPAAPAPRPPAGEIELPPIRR